MAGIAGFKGKLVIGTSGIVAEVQGWSIEEKGATIEDTAMDSAAVGPVPKTFIAGLTEWTGKANGNYSPADNDGQMAALVGTSMAFKLYPEGDASGKEYVSGTAFITGRTRSAQIAGKIEFSIDFQGTGALTEATV